MEDLGDPTSYLTLEPGTPVYASDGRDLGRVHHVLADTGDDLFEGIVLDTSHLPGGHRFVDEEQVGSIHERGVLLTISGEEAEALPEPSENPSALAAGPDDQVPDHLADRLRRAWHHMKGQS
ncbi:MAG: PRC-barrel domain-containing protein [Solirubrobacterales bacterium]